MWEVKWARFHFNRTFRMPETKRCAAQHGKDLFSSRIGRVGIFAALAPFFDQI